MLWVGSVGCGLVCLMVGLILGLCSGLHFLFLVVLHWVRAGLVDVVLKCVPFRVVPVCPVLSRAVPCCSVLSRGAPCCFVLCRLVECC